MNKPRILIVDDDTTLSGLISDALKQAGYQARREKNADAAFSYLKDETPDLILLDIRLPGISGMQFLELLKKEPGTAEIPVIMITTEGETQMKVEGLNVGADDYIVKPFGMKELTARVEALLRRMRHSGQIRRVRELKKIRIDFDQREVSVGGRPVELTNTEFDLLDLLTQRPGHVVSYQAVRDVCRAPDATTETLHSHLAHLRKKLGAGGAAIENIHGIGYKFLP